MMTAKQLQAVSWKRFRIVSASKRIRIREWYATLSTLPHSGRREEDDIVIVSVYLKRSAFFKTLKQAVAQACRSENNTEIKNTCLALMKKFNEIAESWELPHAKLIMKNVKAYQGLFDTHYEEGDKIDDFTKTQRKDFIQMSISDSEKSRVSWQVGKEGEFGDDIEPLDEAFLHEIMTGEKAAVMELSKKSESGYTTILSSNESRIHSGGGEGDYASRRLQDHECPCLYYACIRNSAQPGIRVGG